MAVISGLLISVTQEGGGKRCIADLSSDDGSIERVDIIVGQGEDITARIAREIDQRNKIAQEVADAQALIAAKTSITPSDVPQPDPAVVAAQTAINQYQALKGQADLGIITNADPRLATALANAQAGQTFLDASQGTDAASIDATTTAVSTTITSKTVQPQPVPAQPVVGG